jgi:hypothetical protein
MRSGRCPIAPISNERGISLFYARPNQVVSPTEVYCKVQAFMTPVDSVASKIDTGIRLTKMATR